MSLLLALLIIHHDVNFLTVTSQSMSPTFRAGDVIVTRQISAFSIVENDVLVLPLPENREVFYVHRVVFKDSNVDKIFLQTKGDSNQVKDDWTLQIISKHVPKVIAVLPLNGVIAGPIGRRSIFFSLFAAGTLLLLFGIWRLMRLILS